MSLFDHGHDDQLVKDRKRLPLSTFRRALPRFLLNTCVGLPILSALLPLTMAWYAVALPLKKLAGLFSSKTGKPGVRIPVPSGGIPALQSRKFDLVVFGATGFTGRLATLHLARRYGNDPSLKWAIAGRRKDALEKIRKEAAAICPRLGSDEGLPIVICDTSKGESIAEMVRQTKVLITTVGPFAVHGTPIVEACALYGTSYCDTTGETEWARETVDRFDDLARQNGAKIVHFCAHDCVPWDLCTLAVAKQLRSRGESLAEVRCYDEECGDFSGGTMASVKYLMENVDQGYRSKTLKFDPMLKEPSGKKSDSSLLVRIQLMLGYSFERRKWVGPYILAMTNAECIMRSNALSHYGPNLKYREALVYPGFFAAVAEVIGFMLLGVGLLFPPSRWVMYRFLLPQPGQGMSEKQMDQGFLRVNVIGVGSKGSKAHAMMYFSTDPLYRDTARMLAESGLCALDEIRAASAGKLPAQGCGVLTPATAFGEKLIPRLEASGGTQFSVKLL